MTHIARYIIVLDRMGDDDDCFGPSASNPPRTAQEGMEQVARELQEVMEETGQPAGFFRVVARAEVNYGTGPISHEKDDAAAHHAAMQVLDNTRTY